MNTVSFWFYGEEINGLFVFQFQSNWPNGSGFTSNNAYHMTYNMIIMKMSLVTYKENYLYSLATSDTFLSMSMLLCYLHFFFVFLVMWFVIAMFMISFCVINIFQTDMCKHSNNNATNQIDISIFWPLISESVL